MGIFLDTGFFIGLYHPKDEHHQEAVKIFQDISTGKLGLIYTSPFVISETVTLLFLRTKGNIALLHDLYADLYEESKYVSILSWNPLLEKKIWEKYFQINKKDAQKKESLSFTDISNIVYCEEYKINFIASFDSHFDVFIKIYHSE
jgi:predicted nucleic acid-binding protein